VLAGVNDKFNVAEDVAYSGTMAIAREASFWDVPAIGLSAEGSSVSRRAQVDAIGTLVRVLWEGRAAWSGSGHWLSLNLPDAPACPVGARRAWAATRSAPNARYWNWPGEETTFRIARGRPGTLVPGDERAALAAGNIALVRHRWLADAAIPVATVGAWSRALG
jgi:5'-nucleotidase